MIKLLQLQAEELALNVRLTSADKVSEAITLTSVQLNAEKMMDLTESLRLVYANASEEMADDISELMKELRRTQSSLKKAQDRKGQELHQSNTTTPLRATTPELLSANELEDLVKEIKQEPNDFEPVLASDL